MAWQVFAGAATGKSHLDTGLPCQDAHFHVLVADTLVAAVCDGAGSKSHSEVGAAWFSRSVCEGLAARLGAGEDLLALEPAAFHDAVAAAVDVARTALAADAVAAGIDPDSHAATLVGAVVDGGRGFFFHIGDGQGVAEPREEGAAVVQSLPENGEYANETYFVTGEAWREHLRVTPMPAPVRSLALMSDGAASFVLAKGNAGLFRPFIEPVERYLATASTEDGCKALAATLDDPRTHRITGDDKALLLAWWR